MSIESTILDNQKAISDHEAIYRSSEQAVRDTLINPILDKLGWNTRNLRFVLPNATNEDGRIPDYTLMKEGRKMLIVEAKNMSVELSDPRIINQLVRYCYPPGIKFGIITNGAQWLLFSTFQPNPSERIVWRLDLLKDSIEDTIKKLTCISYENIEQIEQMSSLIYNDEIMKNTWKKVISDKNSMVESLFNIFQQKVKTVYPSFVVDAEAIKAFIKIELIALLTHQPIDSEQISAEHTNASKSTNPEYPGSVNPHNEEESSNKRMKIRIKFPDNTLLYHNKVADTFSEAIKKIGIESVKNLDINRLGVNLISENKHSKYQQYKVSENCFIMTNFSTKDKIKLLHEINQRLNVQMTIETLDSNA
jgi:predicted type IV restriction endonuclease